MRAFNIVFSLRKLEIMKKNIFLLFVIFSISKTFAQYTDPTYTGGCKSLSLENFQIGTTTNTFGSGCTIASDNPYSTATAVTAGNQYAFVAKFNLFGDNGGNGVNFKVWIDKDQNGSFETVLVVETPVTNDLPSINGFYETTGNFAIPSDAVAGTTRLRILIAHDDDNFQAQTINEASDTYINGEFHDYLLDITSSCVPPSAPTASGQTICSGSTASLSATCASGTAKWYNSNTSTTVLGTSSFTTPNLTINTTYYVACESGGSPNCVSTRTPQTVSINQNPALPTAVANSPVCEGQSIMLIANGGTHYSWTGPSGFTSTLSNPSRENATMSYGGNYFVTITNVNNCSATASVNVLINNKPPSPITTTRTFCAENLAASLSINATALLNHTLIWYGNNSTGGTTTNTPIHNPTTSGITNYYVSQINNFTNCESNRATIVVSVNPKPSPPSTTPLALCINAPVQSLTANAGSAVYTLLWYGTSSTGGIGSTIAPAPLTNLVGTTAYYVSTRDNVTLCESNRASLVFTVNPIPNAPSITTNKTTLCGIETATLQATGCNGTIRWNNGSTGTSIVVNLGGTYSAVCENNCGFSSPSNQIIVSKLSTPSAPIISTDRTIICGGNERATLTASNCYGTLNWSNGATANNIQINASGTFTATCTNSCGTSNLSNEVVIRQFFFPRTPTINLSSPILCGETSKTLIASGCNGIIKWNTNITGTTLTVNSAGTYSAVCETLCGSSVQSNIINVQFLVNPTPTASNTGPYEIGQKIQLSASGGSTYIWRGPDDFLSTNADVSILNASLAERGVYTLSVTNASGCSATATTNVVVNPCTQMFKYNYVKAGTDFQWFFPITDGMTISAIPLETGIIATPICELDTINTQSVRLQMTGPNPLFNIDILEKIYPYSPFENRWFQIFGPIFPAGEYTLTTTGYSKDAPSEGIITFGPQTIHFTIVGSSSSVILTNPNLSQICAGSSVNVSFETTGSFNAGNKFEIQLSNANGSFEIPLKIGESISTGVVNCQIPANIPAGTAYKIRVFATNPSLMSSSYSSAFEIKPRSIVLESPNNDISTINNQKASEKITATNKVLSGGNATYQAGRFVLLQAGFTVNSGAVFKAEIKGCNE